LRHEEIVAHLGKVGASKILYPARMEFVREIPLTAAGKADKKILRKDIEEKLKSEAEKSQGSQAA
jgi:non-ribosomal peptide synthetase component E (peptide arylation enzyme)